MNIFKTQNNIPFSLVTNKCNKTSNNQGRSSKCGKSDIPYHKELLLKERVRPLPRSHTIKNCSQRKEFALSRVPIP